MILVSIFFLAIFIFLNVVISSGEKVNPVDAFPEDSVSGGSGGYIEVTEINLQNDNTFDIEPGRVKFEFKDKWYGIQLEEVKDGTSEFLIINLDDGLTDDVSADKISGSFQLTKSGNEGIDLDNDGQEDIVVELNDLTEDINSIGKADFSIRKYKEDLNNDATTELNDASESS